MTRQMRARRSMMSGLGVAAVGVALGSRPLAAQTTGACGRFQPARHQQDAWLDAVAGKHRIFIDASTPRGAGEAILYSNNLYEANKSGYSLGDPDIVVVACLRHFATPFAYNDAICVWRRSGQVYCLERRGAHARGQIALECRPHRNSDFELFTRRLAE